MPSASTAKLEKQASSEAPDPIKQGIVLIEHKIRNLMKKKGRLDSYKEIQATGKELDSDQKQAIKKYDEVCQNLAFAQELSKQFNNIAQEWAKQQQKKEKKEAHERKQQEAAKVKEVLIIQDVLSNMGNETVREDFLAGKNKAVKLTEDELQYLDELFGEVSPKREPEEGQPPFPEQAQNAAKHLLNIVEGRDKEVIGTKYSVLKELIEKINNCGYFDGSAAQEEIAPQEMVEETVIEAEQPLEIQSEHEELQTIPTTTFQPSAPVGLDLDPVPPPPVTETAGLYISQRPMADVLTNVMGPGPTTFSFIQESELEPEAAVAAVPAAMPIPTQTFTNANFAPPPGGAAPPPVAVYAPPQPYTPTPQYAPSIPASQPPQVPSQTFEASNSFQTTAQSGAGDWNETPEPSNEWSDQPEPAEQPSHWNEPAPQSDEWADSSSDGFQTAGRGGRGGPRRGGDRGGSERGRGGPRGGGRGYQGNRGGSQNGRGGGGGGYYNRNNNDAGYYREQNGYRDREGGPRRGGGGPRGGGPDRGGPRGAPRGGRGGAGGPRGSNRGNRQ